MAGKPRKAAEALDGEEEAAPVEVAESKPAPKKHFIPFDPDEDHATIHGGTTRARFVQDGRYYDGKFNPCER